MLIRFNFKNFKSFKNENCLDMEATSSKEHEQNIAKLDNGEYLRISAIYGANASGKTSMLEAFDYMRKRILISDDAKKDFPIEEEPMYSFMMNNDPIVLEVEIAAKNNKIYKYGLELLNNNIISEWLCEKRVNKFYTIFERKNNKIKMMKDNKLSKIVNIDEKTVFLNIYNKIDKNNEEIHTIYNWFENSTYLNLGNPNFERLSNNRVVFKIVSDEKYKKELVKFMKLLDPGIEDIRVVSDSIEALKVKNAMIDMEVLRKGEKKELKALPFHLESDGIRKIVYIYDFIMDALENGKVIWMDELEEKLHPLVTRYIIHLFHNSKTNKGNGQLIYATHDAVNLKREIFRRDEIWFVEKDKEGISKTYALANCIVGKDKKSRRKVRKDAIYNKEYLNGKYGAIPVLEDWK